MLKLQDKIERQSIVKVSWYQKGGSEFVPVPILGPDIFDPRQIQLIREHTLGEGAQRSAGADSGAATFIPEPLSADLKSTLEAVRKRYLAQHMKQPA